MSIRGGFKATRLIELARGLAVQAWCVLTWTASARTAGQRLR